MRAKPLSSFYVARRRSFVRVSVVGLRHESHMGAKPVQISDRTAGAHERQARPVHAVLHAEQTQLLQYL